MKKFSLGIRAKLTVFVLLISLIPLGFLGIQAFNKQKSIITEEVTQNHKELSNLLAHGIYQNLEFTRKLLNSVASIEPIRSLNTPITEDFFSALTSNFSFFKVIYLVGSNRHIIATTDNSAILPDKWLYSNAIKRSYQGSLSEVSKTQEGTPYMTLEAIIKSPEKHGIVGVLISEVNLLSIKQLLKTALKSSKSEGLVLDESGAIIAKSNSSAKSFAFSPAEVIDNDITRLKTIDGEPYLITAVSLKKFDFYQAPNWTIILQIPEKTAFKAAYKFKSSILYLFIITAIISIFLSLMLARKFILQLGNLIEGSEQIMQGNFNKELSKQSEDEIGQLTATFDEMRINLKETKSDLDYRILQLSTLYEVGKAISSELDFKKLQNKILETVVKVLSAEKGSLMLLDDSEKVLTIGVAVGLSEQIATQTRLEVGQSIAGWVVQNRKPLFIKDTEKDSEFHSIKQTNIKKGTLMCVPLIAKERLLGTINVSKSTAASFSDKDFELFTNLANQAAIAIENARLYRYAVTDEMTKLYNHRYFQHRLDEELQRADRYESKVSLIILDIDHFKNFNDTYGHQQGDRVLKVVASLIEKSIREVDIPARYGGEEFIVICPEKNAEGSMVPANRIKETIESYDFRINGKQVPITASLGVACYPDQATSKKTLISKADSALYYSKEHGRNQANLYNPIMDKQLKG
jgi:diguanylate cyclase (GGDEF)-like protein